MSAKADYHRITATDADWSQAAESERTTPKAPDDKRLRGEHTSPGQMQRYLVGGIVLDRWADEHAVELDDTVAKATDWGDLLIPQDQLDKRPHSRFAHLHAPAKKIGHSTIWLFIGWVWAREVIELGVPMDLPKKPRRVRIADLHTPDELAAELRALDRPRVSP